MEVIKTVEQARAIINELQSKLDKAIKEKLKAQSIIYNLLYNDGELPKDMDLKAQVAYFKTELDRVIEQRQKLKEIINTIK